MKKKVVIVIPTHKTSFSEGEKISLKHLSHFLGKFDTQYVLPIDHKVADMIPCYEAVFFPKKYFTSIASYCELLNREEFYKPFADYEYMLIYHVDALVFSSNLLDWCDKGYDYIGPPWPQPIIGYLSHAKNSPLFGANGGFSLRNIEKCIKVIRAVNREAKRETQSQRMRKWWFIKAVLTGRSHEKWLEAPADCYPFNEDGFWSYEASKYLSSFRVAPLEVATAFGFEQRPRWYFEKNNKTLPFGCHAWEQYDKEFWEQFFLL